VGYLAEGEVGFFESVKADFLRFRTLQEAGGGSRLKRSIDIATWPSFHGVVVFRAARAAQRYGLVPIARLLQYLNEVVWFLEFSAKAVVGPGLIVLHPGCGCAAGTRIGKNCTMLLFVQMGVAGRRDATKDGVPVVGDDVVFAANSSVWGPVTIGSRTTIGTGVRVMQDIPEDSWVVAEQPLRIVTRKRKPQKAESEVPSLVSDEVPEEAV
jgi:serine O-acetyltransferase